MTASKAVQRLGIKHCELCGRDGEEMNPLTIHHCSGDRKNNERTNLMVVHRWRCHTLADAITQEYMHRGLRPCTWAIIKKAYKLFHPLI